MTITRKSILAARRSFKFDADQPRDDHGRWSGGGGSSAAAGASNRDNRSTGGGSSSARSTGSANSGSSLRNAVGKTLSAGVTAVKIVAVAAAVVVALSLVGQGAALVAMHRFTQRTATRRVLSSASPGRQFLNELRRGRKSAAEPFTAGEIAKLHAPDGLSESEARRLLDKLLSLLTDEEATKMLEELRKRGVIK